MPDRYSECGDNRNCDWDLDFDTMWVQYLDVGQGDGTFLYFPPTDESDAETVLIDLGSKKNAEVAGSCARQFVYCALKQIQAREGWARPYLDQLFVTHGDGDHYNLILPLLDMFVADGQPLGIGQLIIGGRAPDYATDFRRDLIQPMSAAKRLAVLANSAYDPAGDGPSWWYMDGEACLYLLSANFPDGVRGPKNPKSIVLMLGFNGTDDYVKAVFMGDAEGSVEVEVMDNYDAVFLRSDSLKLGHHGSKAGTTDEWVQTLEPSVVFASADMKWAHPYCEVLARVKENTDLWNDLIDHGYLCGVGAGVAKRYEMHEGTEIGIFVNMVELTKYAAGPPPKRRKTEGRPTSTMAEMETVQGARFQMAIEADGSVVISQGALLPGARMREVYRRPARGKPAGFQPPRPRRAPTSLGG
jgi:beta-lactamase superfamily II metal-dependent hydrolase